MNLSACVIVKDEEKNLPRWLHCMQGLADELIIVDTGSTDRTVEIAQQAGAQVYEFHWQDDFAAAKNFAIEQAAGEWILFLDADESFAAEARAQLRPLLQTLQKKRLVAGLISPLTSINPQNPEEVVSRCYQVRVFRREKTIRYQGRIHERLVNTDKEKVTREFRMSNLVIIHTGYYFDNAQAKGERNLRILKSEIGPEGRPTPDQCIYLADACLLLERYEETINYAKQVLAQEDKVHILGMIQKAADRLLTAMYRSGRPLAEQLMAADELINRHPDWPVLYWNKGRALYQAGALAEAAVQLRTARMLYQDKDQTADSEQLREDTMVQYLPILEQILTTVELSSTTAEKPNVAKLTVQMDRAYEAGDMDSAKIAATGILRCRTRNRPLMEKVCSLFIDLEDNARAREAADFLTQNFRSNGYLLFLQGRTAGLEMDYEQAIQLCEQALQDREMPGWQRELCYNILGRMYRLCGMAAKASTQYLAASQCEGTMAAVDDYSNYLFNLHYWNEDRHFFYEAACRYRGFLSNIVPFHHTHQLGGVDERRLKIGYVSPDFRYHVVAFFCYAMLKHYDPSRFEVYVYAKCEEDEVSREFAASVDHWMNIRQLSAQAAAMDIQADGIDILVDLSGHTADSCLPILAWRPAPIQISGIGWFDTTGLPQVDYFLADGYTDPPGLNEEYFSEKLLRLPHSHFCYMWHNKPQPCAPAPFRKNGFITFGTLNHFAKITDQMLVLWRKILEQVPDSRLFLKNHTVDIPYGRKCLEDRLHQAGIQSARIILEGYSDDFLSAYSKIDIALDTYPYPGGATTCDALYMGVPVLTRVGEGHNPRFGYSLLMNMGLEELCAFSDEDYVCRAAALAGNPDKLLELHQTLRRRMRWSPVMDEGLYMAELEEAYLQVWQAYIGGSASVAELPPKECARRGVSYLREPGETSQQRAVYWLRRALADDEENCVEIAGFLAEACHDRLDYQGEYEAAWQAVAALGKSPHLLSREFRHALYVRAANAALTMGDYSRALAAFRQAVAYSESLADRNSSLGSLLLATHYTELDSRQLFDLHQPYGRLFNSVEPFHHPLSKHQHKKLRIGYLSPDFRQHVLFAFYYGMLCCYDRWVFEVTGYQINPETDGFTEILKQQTDNWRDLSGLPWAEAAEQIAADEIDILVDLAGHSADTGLPIMAWKPAPVQVSGIGYMATTALQTVDYFLTDPIVDPPGQHEDCFTEKLLYLPSQFCYAGRSDVSVPDKAPVHRRGHILFGVFNHYRKITDEMLRAWFEILAAVPEAELLLKSQELVSDSLVQAAYERVRSIGFDMDRVHFEAADTNYMERYLDVDIALDTYPYPGGGTTFDALYMGVPVITRYGERRNTRFGLSILENLGLSELTSATIEGYIERAVSLAHDPDLLDILHQNLRGLLQKSSALEPRQYMRQLEQHYREIWLDYQTGRNE